MLTVNSAGCLRRGPRAGRLQRSPDDHTEPATVDIPAIGAGVGAGELIAAQIPRILSGAAPTDLKCTMPARVARCGHTLPGRLTQPGSRPGSGHSLRQDGHTTRPMTTAGAGPSTKGEVTRKTAIAIGGPCATARIAKLNARNRGWNTGSKPALIDGRNSRICRIEYVQSIGSARI
jgi:hypothetical protein